MKAIETTWKGWKFRSRTEARWAVFLEAAGIGFEYEPEGVILPSGPYLPDFRLYGLPAASDGADEVVWLEIKGDVPTDLERQKCVDLASATGQVVLLASGSPDFREQISIFEPMVDESLRGTISLLAGLFTFANIGSPPSVRICLARSPEREPEQLQATDPAAQQLVANLNLVLRAGCKLLGGGSVEPADRTIHLSDRLKAAYDKARGARFEFGETDKRWTP